MASGTAEGWILQQSVQYSDLWRTAYAGGTEKKKSVSKKEKKQGRKRSAVNCLKVVMEVKQGEEGFKKGKWIQSQNIPWH